MSSWLKHAFAVDPPGAATPTEAQREVVQRLAREVVRRRLTQPAMLALEMSGPLNFVSAQGLHFFQPIVTSLTDGRGYDEFARFLEQRGALEYIRGCIDAYEQERVRSERADLP